MLNISKKRKFSKPGDNCPYHTYQLTRKQRGNYVNVWFPGEDLVLKKKRVKKFLTKKSSPKKSLRKKLKSQKKKKNQ